MSEVALNKSGTEFRRGAQSGISIGIGYFPVAITFGLLAKTTGLSLGETLLMSFVVYAGAAQYISLNLLTLGTGAFEIVLTTLIVNIRHFLMSASLNEKSDPDPPLAKSIYSFGITDETFSVAAVKEGTVSAGYMFGLNLVAYLSWGICSGVGHVVGEFLPQTLQESMSVALYAMFVGLLVPSMKKGVKAIYLAVLAAIFNSIFTFTEMMSTGWGIVAATLLSAFIVELITMVKEREGGQKDEE